MTTYITSKVFLRQTIAAVISGSVLAAGSIAILPLMTQLSAAASVSSYEIVRTRSFFPATGVLDRFEQDGPISTEDWDGDTATIRVKSKHLIATAGGSSAIYWVTPVVGNHEAAIKLIRFDPRPLAEIGVLLGVHEGGWAAGAVKVIYKSRPKLIQVWTYHPSQGWRQRGLDIALEFFKDDYLGARLLDTGFVEVYRNAVLIGSMTVGDWPASASPADSGRIGIWLSNARKAVLDDFVGGSTPNELTPIPSLTPESTPTPTSTPSPTDSNNLLRDGSFEAGLAPAWEPNIHSGTVVEFSSDTTTAADGRASVKVTVIQSGVAWSAQLRQFGLTFSGGRHYQLTFKTKSTAPLSAPLTAEIQTNPADPVNHATVSFNPRNQPDGSWGEVRAMFRPVDTITDAVLSFSFGTASGDIWLDDVRILDMTDALVPNSDHATLIFNDDFDEAALDRNKWNQLIPCAGVTCYNPNDLGYPAWHNIVQMGDGFLRLRAQREVTTVTNPPGSPEGAYTFSYTTGVVSSWRNFDFHYGYVEVRAKLPGGKGVWPAIWTNCYFELTQPTCWPTGGEIDIVELYGDQPNVHEHSIHYIGITNGKSCSTLPGHQCDSITVPAGDMTNDFHVYVVDWRVDRVIWYVDGVEVFHSTHSPAAINYVVLDVKLNGIGGHILPDETTPLPAEMVVDYVRVWRWK